MLQAIAGLAILLRALYLLIRVFFSTIFTRLWAFILFALPHLLKKILALFGVGFATYSGFDFLIDKLESVIFSRFEALPSDILSILLLAKVDKGLSIVFAAIAIAITIKVSNMSVKLVPKGLVA